MSANFPRMTGNFKATNAELTVEGDVVGFRPSKVEITNETNDCKFEWHEGMGDDTGVLTLAAGTRTYLESDGLTPTATGFTIAAIANINDTTGAAAEALSFFALG